MENPFDRRSQSLWMDIDVAPNARPLQGDQACDVVVIGSGIAGISTAYELAIATLEPKLISKSYAASGNARILSSFWIW
jgi:heterodisulfide reductase subunit A-like polyferredoxin